MMKFNEALKIVFDLAEQNAIDPDDVDGLDDALTEECTRQHEALDEVAQWLGVYGK